MRILVTGSRDWPDERLICRVLNEYRTKDPKHYDGHHILVSGACPSGADKLAEDYATDVGWYVEQHPAEWFQFGVFKRSAGYIRNSEMVKLGADVCLAFIKDESKGATHCAGLAQDAGIPTKIWRM